VWFLRLWEQTYSLQYFSIRPCRWEGWSNYIVVTRKTRSVTRCVTWWESPGHHTVLLTMRQSDWSVAVKPACPLTDRLCVCVCVCVLVDDDDGRLSSLTTTTTIARTCQLDPITATVTLNLSRRRQLFLTAVSSLLLAGNMCRLHSPPPVSSRLHRACQGYLWCSSVDGPLFHTGHFLFEILLWNAGPCANCTHWICPGRLS